MSEARYIISDAAKKVSVEPHVLRYWEEELDLKIPRNEMGHRYYRERDIEILKMVKLLKDKGYQLKAIKMEVETMEKELDIVPMSKQENKNLEETKQISTNSYEPSQKTERISTNSYEVSQKTEHIPTNSYEVSKKTEQDTLDALGREERMMQFRMIMSDIIGQALKDNTQDLSFAVTHSISEHVLKEMDYLAREREEKDEAHYQRIDELIREIQKNRAEVAAHLETTTSDKKKKRFFCKK